MIYLEGKQSWGNGLEATEVSELLDLREDRENKNREWAIQVGRLECGWWR